MTLQPLSDFVALKKDKDDSVKKTEGGLYVPTSSGEEKIVLGTVIAVGPGRITDQGLLIPTKLVPGDKVYFHKSTASELRVDGEMILMLREEHLLAVLAQ